MQQKVTAKERIVAAAKQLFAERGFHRTAMAELAEYAQVSVGAIYRSFASKSEIISAIVMADTEQTLGELEVCIEDVRAGRIDGRAAIERLMLQWVSKRTDALTYEIIAEIHRNPDMAEIISRICGQYRDQFRNLAKLLQPELDTSEVEGAAELLLACLFGMGNRDFTHPKLDESQTAASVTRLVLQGLKIESR